MKRSALVIGATGLVGYGLMRELLDAQYTVTAVARGQTQCVPALPNIRVQHLDRTVDSQVKSLFTDKRWDLVVDCAAFQPAEVETMAKLIRKAVGHYFFISSDFVYAYDPAGTFPTREGDPKVTDNPATPPYALAKLKCEHLLIRAYEDFHSPLTILRPPHVIGAGKPLGCDPVLGRSRQLLDHMKSGKPVPVLVEGKLLVQPIFSRELGRMIAALTGNPRTWGQVFNVAGHECFTVSHYYRLIAKTLGIPLAISSVSHASFLHEHPDRSPFCRHRCYDLSHLRALTGYKHYYNLEEGFHETIEWMKQQSTAAPSAA